MHLKLTQLSKQFCFTEKDVIVIFSPMFKVVRERLNNLLDPRFKIFSDLSPSDFCKKLTSEIPPESVAGCFPIEVDISKYDKSHGPGLLEFECNLYAFWVDFWRSTKRHA